MWWTWPEIKQEAAPVMPKQEIPAENLTSQEATDVSLNNSLKNIRTLNKSESKETKAETNVINSIWNKVSIELKVNQPKASEQEILKSQYDEVKANLDNIKQYVNDRASIIKKGWTPFKREEYHKVIDLGKIVHDYTSSTEEGNVLEVTKEEQTMQDIVTTVASNGDDGVQADFWDMTDQERADKKAANEKAATGK